jgi:hypothetical protein
MKAGLVVGDGQLHFAVAVRVRRCCWCWMLLIDYTEQPPMRQLQLQFPISAGFYVAV